MGELNLMLTPLNNKSLDWQMSLLFLIAFTQFSLGFNTLFKTVDTLLKVTQNLIE